MSKAKTIHLFVADDDKRQYMIRSLLDSLAEETDWLDLVEGENEKGRDLTHYLDSESQIRRCEADYLERGYSRIEPETMFDSPPRDRSADYQGALPKYAQGVDRSLLVRVFCKKRCGGKMAWARLEKPYPGAEELKAAEMFEYRATCLRCGGEALDNYNWMR